MLLILDLDETVVFASRTRFGRLPDFELGEYFVYRRPGLDEFIAYAARQFQIAVWTSSGSEYAQSVVRQIFPDPGILQFVWSRERCTIRLDPETREEYHVKDLKKVKKLGHALEQTLIVDDSPEKIERSYGNHIRVAAYDGSPDDNELLLLMRYLDRIKDVPNVRRVEKRTWRQQVIAGRMT